MGRKEINLHLNTVRTDRGIRTLQLPFYIFLTCGNTITLQILVGYKACQHTAPSKWISATCIIYRVSQILEDVQTSSRGQPSLLSDGTGVTSRGSSDWGVILTNHLYSTPLTRLHGVDKDKFTFTFHYGFKEIETVEGLLSMYVIVRLETPVKLA
jgi:hypothetical protein